MGVGRKKWWARLAALAVLANTGTGCVTTQPVPPPLLAPLPAPEQLPLTAPDPPPAPVLAGPAGEACDRPLPINLPTAFQLAQARPIDVALASERIRLAVADWERARVLWLPTLQFGLDYFRHDGRLQDVAGNMLDTSKSTFMLGLSPQLVFATSDALFAPLAARQVVRSREATLQAARNDSLLAVAEAYFNVQQARGELAGALHALAKAEDLARRAEELTKSLVPEVEASRTRTELARRRQQVASARERWRVASAELARVLRLDASALVEPLEPPHLRIDLIEPGRSLDDLIPIALLNRPELAAQQALVQATIERLRQEKLRPLMPSVLLRGASTNPAGTLAAGVFGGGRNESINNFGMRGDFDVQVLWELQNLGLGNLARVNSARSDNRLALLELFRTQDRIAAEVVQAHAQLQSANDRLREAEAGLKDAAQTVEQSLEGMKQTRTATGVSGRPIVLLVVRPQEAVAAVQALAQAYADYYGAVTDYDRAQFRLFRALGQPSQLLAGAGCP